MELKKDAISLKPVSFPIRSRDGHVIGSWGIMALYAAPTLSTPWTFSRASCPLHSRELLPTVPT